MTHFRINNWRKFQKYRDRNPSWICLYVELLDDDDFEQLTDAERWHLCAIWLLAARRDRPGKDGFENGPSLKFDAAWVKRKCCLSSDPDLNRLATLGYIDCYETVTSSSRNRYSETDTETDAETDAETQEYPVAPSAPASRDEVRLQEYGEWVQSLRTHRDRDDAPVSVISYYVEQMEIGVKAFYQDRGGRFTPTKMAKLASRMGKCSFGAQMLAMEVYCDRSAGLKDERYLAGIATRLHRLSKTEFKAEMARHRLQFRETGTYKGATG